MARKKPVPTVMISDSAEADRVLEELADLERQANVVKNALNEAIDQAKARAAEDMVEIGTRVKVLEAALSGFALANKSTLFKDKKSLELDFGTLSFRRSSKIVTAGKGVTWEMVLEKIKDQGYSEAIRIKEEVNKEALAGWDDDKLGQIAVKRKTEDSFGYELKQQDPGLSQTQAA